MGGGTLGPVDSVGPGDELAVGTMITGPVVTGPSSTDPPIVISSGYSRTESSSGFCCAGFVGSGEIENVM